MTNVICVPGGTVNVLGFAPAAVIVMVVADGGGLEGVDAELPEHARATAAVAANEATASRTQITPFIRSLDRESAPTSKQFCVAKSLHHKGHPGHNGFIFKAFVSIGSYAVVEIALIEPILGEVIGEGALADTHQLSGVFLDAAGAFERAPNGFLLDPLDVLP